VTEQPWTVYAISDPEIVLRLYPGQRLQLCSGAARMNLRVDRIEDGEAICVRMSRIEWALASAIGWVRGQFFRWRHR
jgi:hypothetical protein